MRTILPTATIIIAQEAHGAGDMGVPALAPCPSWEPPHSLPERIVKAAGARFRRHVHAGLRREDFARATAFLATHRPTALLVEYLDHAANFIDLARATGTPVYAYAHGYEVAAAARDRRVARHVTRVFRAATGIIAASVFMKDKLASLGCPREKIAIAPPGVDPKRFSVSHAEAGRVLAVGRLV
ncbi:MAG: glycosyltransferase, partial [Acidiferrobacterales bacterium]|nr:glycosyltransferase [Acidiferrobacterales bacterium]